jgi:hypothetical protein
MKIKTVYLYQRTQSFKLTQNISKFIIIWWERRLKKTLLSWSITQHEKYGCRIFDQGFFANKHEYF